MRISDWSLDVCSSDLRGVLGHPRPRSRRRDRRESGPALSVHADASVGGGPPQRPQARPRGHRSAGPAAEIGRASCRERVCQYGKFTVVAASSQKKKKMTLSKNIIPKTMTNIKN